MLHANASASAISRAVTAREATSRGGVRPDAVRSAVMEGREQRDPGYDDWFDEPEPPTETLSSAYRGLHDEAEEVWVLPEDEAARRPRGGREIVVAGRT